MATTIDGSKITPTRALPGTVVGQSVDGDTMLTYNGFKTFIVFTHHSRAGWLTHTSFTIPEMVEREKAEEIAAEWLSANVPTLF